MHDLLTRHAVHVLRAAGFSMARAATHAKVSKATAGRMAQEEAVTEAMIVAAAEARGGLGRPSVARPYAAAVQAILQESPTLPGVEILHRLKIQGYAGGKSAVYALVQALRPTPVPPPMVRFEGLAGEFSQHDFGSVRVAYGNGTSEIVHFFASKLKYSRWVHVVLVPNEQVEALMRALLLAFADFGGVPLVAVFDNPKTIVLDRDGDRIEWNPTFAQVVLDYRFAPELCFPRMANQKGAVENLVGWVKGSFFKVRRFHDRPDLDTQRQEWLHEVNTVRPSRATGVPPAARIEEERQRLRPLPVVPADYPLRFPVFVGPTGYVVFQGIQYSMPPATIHRAATLFLYPERVKILAQPYVAEHPRVPAHGKISTLPDHSAAAVAQVSGQRAKLYFQRQRLLETGAAAEAFLTELVHARPRVWRADVEALFTALQQVGAERLLAAVRVAHARQCFGAEYVVAFLQEPT